MRVRYLIATEIKDLTGFRDRGENPKEIKFNTEVGNLTLEELGNMGWTLAAINRETWVFQQQDN